MHNPFDPFFGEIDGSQCRAIQTRAEKIALALGGGASVTKFSREFPRFFFERTSGEFRAICAVTEVFAAPLFQSATAFALRDVNEIVQNQFAIVPGVDPNNQCVTEPHASRVIGEDADAF